MKPLHSNHSAAAALKPLAACPAVRRAVRPVVGLLTIPAVLMISGEVGAP